MTMSRGGEKGAGNVGTKRVAQKVASKKVPVPEPEEVKKTKKKSKPTRDWMNYIRKLVHQSESEMPVGNRVRLKPSALNALCSLVNDILDRIGNEAGNLCKFTKSSKLRLRDVKSAVTFVTCHTEVGKFMNEDGDRAVKALIARQGGADASRKT